MVGDHEQARKDFINVAVHTLGLPSSIFHRLSPAAIMHFDRDPVNNFNPQLAATGAKWALLEFLVLSACDGVVASSGYGLTAAAVGGLSPQRTLFLKQGSAAGARRCFPSDAAPWMESL